MLGEYKIVPKDDELYHWKYIRKERLGPGKWKYYYKTSMKDKFKWGYQQGSKRDANGKLLSKGSIDPMVYRNRANVLKKQYDEHNTPFYRGYEPHNVKKAMKALEKAGVAMETTAHIADSKTAQIGQFVGRTVSSVSDVAKKGKNWLDEQFGR